MKPGKPIAFGSRGDGKLWFGLPGNPLSAWTGLLLFVAESLGHSLSSSWRPLSHEVKRKAGREEFIPCTWDEDGKAGLIDTVGSHSNMALVGADGLARIPAKQEYMAVGSPVQTYRFPWSNAA